MIKKNIVFVKDDEISPTPKDGFEPVEMTKKEYRNFGKEFCKIYVKDNLWRSTFKKNFTEIKIKTKEFQKLKKGKLSIKKNKLVKEKSFKKSKHSIVKTLWNHETNKLVLIFPDGSEKEL